MNDESADILLKLALTISGVLLFYAFISWSPNH